VHFSLSVGVPVKIPPNPPLQMPERKKMKKHPLRILISLTLFLLSCAVTAAQARETPSGEDCVAVAFTGPDQNGFSWIVPRGGEYDLQDFNLPNDSISSFMIKPGFTAVFYEHANFQGDTLEVARSSSFPEKWQGQASSFKIVPSKNTEPQAEAQWKKNVTQIAAFTPIHVSALPPEEFAEALVESAFNVGVFGMDRGRAAKQWESYSDEQKQQLAQNILNTFASLGYAVSGMDTGKFARQVNGFIGWRPDASTWDASVAALGISQEISWVPDISKRVPGIWVVNKVENLNELNERQKELLETVVPGLSLNFDDKGQLVLTERENRVSSAYSIKGNEILYDSEKIPDVEIRWNAWYKGIVVKGGGILFVMSKKQ